MELANVFLETDEGKLPLRFELPPPCQRTGREMREALEHFLSVLDKYMHVDKSTFYMAVRDGELLYFRCENGRVAPVEHDFFVFDDVFDFAKEPAEVRAVTFVLTDRMPVLLRMRKRYALRAYANSRRYYGAT